MSTILCDVDGVIADLHGEWLARYNADYDDDLTVDRIHQWDMLPAVKKECGAKIYAYLNHPDLYECVRPIPGALGGVRSLRAAGHRVVFLTACSGPEMVAGKIEWLFRHGFLDEPMHVGMSDLIIALDKSLAHGDLLIDDYDGNCDVFGGPSILLSAPYNAAAEHPHRARTWKQIVDLAKEMV